MPKGSWNVSVQEMVKASERIDHSFGVQGYTMVDYNVHIDKPTVYKIAPKTDKLKDYISVINKRESKLPGPHHYKA